MIDEESTKTINQKIALHFYLECHRIILKKIHFCGGVHIQILHCTLSHGAWICVTTRKADLDLLEPSWGMGLYNRMGNLRISPKNANKNRSYYSRFDMA